MKEGDPVVVVVVLVAAGARGGGEDGSTRAAAPSGRRVAVKAAKLRDFRRPRSFSRSGVWNLERKQEPQQHDCTNQVPGATAGRTGRSAGLRIRLLGHFFVLGFKFEVLKFVWAKF